MSITDSFEFGSVGVGQEPLLTMKVETGSSEDVLQADIDALQVSGSDVPVAVAVVITGNNTVGLGSDGEKLFGGILAVSGQLSSSIPVSCTVQVRGVCRFKYVSTTPVVNQMVEVDGAGKVSQATADTDIAAGGHLARGMVMAVDTTNTTVDVWLG